MNTSTHIPGLIFGTWQEQVFEPFRDGVEICTLHEGVQAIPAQGPEAGDQPAIALLRYQPGAGLP